MADSYFGTICLSDIPKGLITTGKNGKKYLSVVVNKRREADKYGHTHYIKAYAKKGAAPPNVNFYIGELKPSEYQAGQAQSLPTTPPPPTAQGDDLPF